MTQDRKTPMTVLTIATVLLLLGVGYHFGKEIGITEGYLSSVEDSRKNDGVPQCPQGTFYNSNLPWGIGGLMQCDPLPSLKEVVCVQGATVPTGYIHADQLNVFPGLVFGKCQPGWTPVIPKNKVADIKRDLGLASIGQNIDREEKVPTIKRGPRLSAADQKRFEHDVLLNLLDETVQVLELGCTKHIFDANGDHITCETPCVQERSPLGRCIRPDLRGLLDKEGV